MEETGHRKFSQRFLPFAVIAVSLLSITDVPAAPRHVYLTWQGDTGTTITVNYHTTGNFSSSTVYYDTVPHNGVVGDYPFRVVGLSHKIQGLAAFTDRTIHVVELTGLTPGQRYYFIAGDSTNGFSEERKFRTVPDSGEPIRFVTGGDMSTSDAARDLQALAGQQDPMFGLIGGDIAYVNGELKEWQNWDEWLDNWNELMVTLDGRMVPMVLAIGNHEVDGGYGETPDEAPFYYGYFAQGGSSYFSRPIGGNSALFVLDSGHTADHDGPQADWLTNEMSRYTGVPNKMAIYHVPLYPGHRDFNTSNSTAGREHWLPIFDRNQLTVAFENHDHVMKRTKLLKANQVDSTGTLYIGDGCFGRSPRGAGQAGAFYLERVEKTRHFWVVEIPEAGSSSGSGMSFTAIDDAGVMFDFYRLRSKTAALAITSPTNGARFTEGDSITITASAFGAGGTVTSVDFFQGLTPLASSATSPFSFVWGNVPAGSFSLTAVAHLSDGTSFNSEPVTVFIQPSGIISNTVRKFTPTDDAYVRSDKPNQIYGAGRNLRVREANSTYHAFIKFDVRNLTSPPKSANLRFFVADGSNDGGALYLVSNEYLDTNESWSEDSLTWNNAPAITGSPLDVLGAVEKNEWIEFDVAAAISGDLTYSFGLTKSTSNRIKYRTHESSTPPELVIELLAPPVISSLVPESGTTGSEITIKGMNLGTLTQVSFNGTSVTSFAIDSVSQVRTTVPLGASTGIITVTNPDGTAESPTEFSVLFPPAIASFTPMSGPVATPVTIVGTNLATTAEVLFNGVLDSSFTVLSDSSIAATVPPGATAGKIQITNADGSAESPEEFTVFLPPTILSFEPAAAEIAALVWIAGSNFEGAAGVTFNGVADTTFVIESDSSIAATVPVGAATGKIRVTNRGGSTESVADFRVLRPPAIYSFLPTNGPIGTAVSIAGANLQQVSEVSFSGVADSAFTVRSDSLLIATVPVKAKTGPIRVVNADGAAESVTGFTVYQPPVLFSFAPVSGPAGTAINISGAGLSEVSEVTFNGRSDSTFATVSDSLIQATVPAGATTGKIRLVGKGGETESVQEFIVLRPPTILAFVPALGVPGTEVTINGLNFSEVGSASFGGVFDSTFVVESNTRLRATVPEGATTGKIRLANLYGTAETLEDFIIPLQPSISSFAPASGRAGTAVAITGSSLSHLIEIFFNGTADTTFAIVSDSLAKASVPSTATSGKIRVANMRGVAESDSSFTVLDPPIISSFTPPSGVIGTRVTIQGSRFAEVVAVSFNGVIDSTFVVLSDSLISATVPSEATTGKLQVTNHDGTTESGSDFRVLIPPTIAAFAPLSGPVGSRVTITGSRFENAVEVSFNGFADSTFTVDSDSLIRATVPPEATSGKIGVANADGTSQSAQDFMVLTAPIITAFSPGRGPSGTTVTIAGSNFSPAISVSFGGTVDSTFTVASDTLIRASVPEGASSGKITVANPGGAAESLDDFTVLLSPRIESFVPVSGPIGTEVTVSGANFDDSTTVSFNGVTASVVTVDSTTQIRVLVPLQAATGPIVVSNADGTVESSEEFQVLVIHRFHPTHDSYVRSVRPGKRFGGKSELHVVGGPRVENVYLKFDVRGLAGVVRSARIRLFVLSGSDDGGAIYSVANEYKGTATEWDESALVWNNAPTVTGSPIDELHDVDVGEWVEFDVTAAVVKDDSYSFAITTDSLNRAKYGTKEGITPPELLVSVLVTVSTASKVTESSDFDGSAMADSEDLPESFRLSQNYPNPFNLETTIEYSLPQNSHVRLVIYNLRGQQIRVLVDEPQTAGYKNTPWNGRNDFGREVATGVYVMRLTAGGQASSRKLLLLK